MFSNSRDQISLEEAYNNVNKNVINESLVEVATAVKDAIASTGHMSPQIQAMVTLASGVIPGLAGAAAVAGIQKLASRVGVTDMLNKFKNMLVGKPIQQQKEMLNDISTKSSKEIADAYIANPTPENLDAFLNDLAQGLEHAKNSHVDRSHKKMANAIDGVVKQESYTGNYLSAAGKSKGKESESKVEGSTLQYLKS